MPPETQCENKRKLQTNRKNDQILRTHTHTRKLRNFRINWIKAIVQIKYVSLKIKYRTMGRGWEDFSYIIITKLFSCSFDFHPKHFSIVNHLRTAWIVYHFGQDDRTQPFLPLYQNVNSLKTVFDGTPNAKDRRAGSVQTIKCHFAYQV